MWFDCFDVSGSGSSAALFWEKKSLNLVPFLSYKISQLSLHPHTHPIHPSILPPTHPIFDSVFSLLSQSSKTLNPWFCLTSRQWLAFWTSLGASTWRSLLKLHCCIFLWCFHFSCSMLQSQRHMTKPSQHFHREERTLIKYSESQKGNVHFKV